MVTTEWLARDGAWRSTTDDPPTIPGEIVATRTAESPAETPAFADFGPLDDDEEEGFF